MFSEANQARNPFLELESKAESGDTDAWVVAPGMFAARRKVCRWTMPKT
jgi:hypothetical protein